MRRLLRVLLTTFVPCMLLTLTTSAAYATTSSDAVDAVNALRAQIGVAPIVNDETLASDCALHAAWMQQHRIASHGESTGSTGYTAAGNDAGEHSVLHIHSGLVPITSIDTIPWLQSAPLHLAQLLHPGLVRSGYAIDGDAACMWTLDSTRHASIDVFNPRRGQGTVYTYPSVRTGKIAPRQDTSTESPNPNTMLGLPSTRATGPYVLVFAGGFGNRDDCNAIRITSVTLTGTDGSRPKVRWWDDARTIAAHHLTSNQCPIPAGSGWFTAEHPLATGTTYTATIKLVGAHAPRGTRATTRRIVLRTTGLDTARPRVRVASMAARLLRGRRYSWRVVASVADASPTTCTATVQTTRVACTIRRGRIVLAGAREGAPSSVRVAIVVRDARDNQQRVHAARHAR